jgi:anti-repressor protein
METNQTLFPNYEQMLEGNLYNMSQVPKILDLGYGRNTLFEKLRGKQILTSRNEPYQQYVNQGYFKLLRKHRPGQPDNCDVVTMATAKGLKFIEKIISGQNDSDN